MTEHPLIWTTAGNVPVADLRHEVEWKVSPEQIIFVESYYLHDSLVKQSSHVKVLIGASAEGAATI